MGVALTVAALSGGVVHAGDDDTGPRAGRSRITYFAGDVAGVAEADDPIAALAEREIVYWECDGFPAVCWPMSNLWFHTYISLGYRSHEFRAKTSVTYGVLPWRGWTEKRNRVRCQFTAETSCGSWFRLPTGKTWNATARYYTPRYTMQPGFLTFRYHACMRGYCAYARQRTGRIYCRAIDTQCYFTG